MSYGEAVESIEKRKKKQSEKRREFYNIKEIILLNFIILDSSYQDRQSAMGSENIMDELATLIRTDIPEGRQSLQDSYTNLARVAEYCEDTYYR